MSIDGDIDFAPKALKLLLRSMKKNPEVGATCGRIKPYSERPKNGGNINI
jgi:chitin synthase